MRMVYGNLLDMAENGDFDVIVHGCNCFHTMGAGIAGQIARRFPDVLVIDKLTTKFADEDKMGSFSVAKIKQENHSNFFILNAYTQFEPGRVFDYEAIRSCFRDIAESKYKSLRIGYCKIGCGIAGGDWDIVSMIIDEELEGLNHTLVEYKG